MMTGTEERLIDANALWKVLDEAELFESGNPRHIAQQTVEEQPTVDAVKVVHAEWTLVIDENDCECIECPLCGEQFYDGDNDTFDKPWNYCPNCGAKMDLEGEK